jgi:hypothetical protein
MTPAEQDADLEEARKRLYPTRFTADRCRHDSVTDTALWIFDGRQQIGSASRNPTGWTANRISRGITAGQRREPTMEAALSYIVSPVSSAL